LNEKNEEIGSTGIFMKRKESESQKLMSKAEKILNEMLDGVDSLTTETIGVKSTIVKLAIDFLNVKQKVKEDGAGDFFKDGEDE
jgi:hypothetical protein